MVTKFIGFVFETDKDKSRKMNIVLTETVTAEYEAKIRRRTEAANGKKSSGI